MTKNVGILIFDDAEVLDFAGPFEVFSTTSQLNNNEPFNVFTIAKEQKMVIAVNGLKVVPDYSMSDHPKIDILIFAGGQGTRKLLEDDVMLQWVWKMHAAAFLTLCICSAARVIGKLGLLDNKPFCTHHEVYDHLNQIAPEAIARKDQRFIKTDERLFTSGGISAGIDLSFHVVDLLLGAEVAARTGKYMEYNYQS